MMFLNVLYLRLSEDESVWGHLLDKDFTQEEKGIKIKTKYTWRLFLGRTCNVSKI